MSQLSIQFSKERQHNKLPLAVSKNDLRLIFGNGVAISVYQLHSKFLTKDFIQKELGMTADEFKAVRLFSFEHTKKIYAYFQITIEDL